MRMKKYKDYDLFNKFIIFLKKSNNKNSYEKIYRIIMQEENNLKSY